MTKDLDKKVAHAMELQYERGFIDGMQKQMQSSVDKAVNRMAQPERHELQAKGEHPAPCARHCEAPAFGIVIKNLKAQLAQKQEPIAMLFGSLPVYDRTTPPQRIWAGLTRDEQSFIYSNLHNATSREDSFWVDFANAIEDRLKEKNT